MPTDFSAESTTQFESDLNRARGYKPVTQKEIRQAYDQYKSVGLRFGQVKKGWTDERLYSRAQRFVLAWWKQQHHEKVKDNHKKQEVRHRAQQDPRGGRRDTWSGGNNTPSYRGGTGGYSGGSGYATIPDTAMKRGTEGGDGGRQLPDIRQRLNPTQVRAVLNNMGVPATWNPPLYAERSPEALKEWVQREAEKQDLVIRANGMRAFLDDGVVQRIGMSIGFPINPDRVPMIRRQSVDEIRQYLLMLKRAAQRREVMRVGTGTSESPRTTASYIVKMRNNV